MHHCTQWATVVVWCWNYYINLKARLDIAFTMFLWCGVEAIPDAEG